MKRKIPLVVLFIVYAINTFLYAEEPPAKILPNTPLPYVVPFITQDATEKNIPITQSAEEAGNAIIVDKERSLFALNAHALAYANTSFVRLQGRWYPVEKRKQWINWHADVALVALSEPHPPLEEEAPLAPKSPSLASLTLTGYLPRHDDGGNISFEPYEIKGFATRIGPLGEDFDNPILQPPQFTRPRELFLYYRRYIQFAVMKEQSPGEERRLWPGISGSPALDEEKNVTAILSSVFHPYGYLVPAFEIKALLKKAKPIIAARRKP